MYVRVNAWIWSSRATRTPYHVRVLRRSSVLWGNHSTLFPHGGLKKGVVEGFAKHNPLCLGVWQILPLRTKHKHLSESLFISTMTVLWLPQSTNLSLSQVDLWLPQGSNSFCLKIPVEVSPLDRSEKLLLQGALVALEYQHYIDGVKHVVNM